MTHDLAHELRTVSARVETHCRDASPYRVRRLTTIFSGERTLAIVYGKRGSFYADVVLTSGDVRQTPTYCTKTEAMLAALVPHIAAVRGEPWSFPAPEVVS